MAKVGKGMPGTRNSKCKGRDTRDKLVGPWYRAREGCGSVECWRGRWGRNTEPEMLC